MPSGKKTALKIIEKMPDNASLEQVMYELFFRQRVDRGLAELATGKIVSHDEVRRSVARWLRSPGR